MDFELSEEQQAFARTAYDFTQAEIAPYAAQWDAECIFPKAVFTKGGTLGFCGLYAPEKIGGLALPRLDSALVLEMAMADPCTAAFLPSTTWPPGCWALGVVTRCVIVLVQLYAKVKCWPLIALTEPGAGSDAASLTTRAQRVAEGYVISGSKAFISGAGSTDVLVVMARTGGPGANGVSAFVVPAHAPGVSYGKQEQKMGWNSQPTGSVHFDQVHVPASYLLGSEGEGFKLAMKGLDGGRINIATCSVGAAQGALEYAQRYVQERHQFGQPLVNFQALQFKLADMVTELVAARQMVRLAAFKLDKGDSSASTYCAMAKRFATDVGFTVCNQALQLLGGHGYLKAHPLERLVRDTRVHQILEGTNEIMRVIIARGLLQRQTGDLR